MHPFKGWLLGTTFVANLRNASPAIALSRISRPNPQCNNIAGGVVTYRRNLAAGVTLDYGSPYDTLNVYLLAIAPAFGA